MTGGQPLARIGMTMATLAAVACTRAVSERNIGTLDLHFFAALSLVAWIASALTSW